MAISMPKIPRQIHGQSKFTFARSRFPALCAGCISATPLLIGFHLKAAPSLLEKSDSGEGRVNPRARYVQEMHADFA